MVLSPLTGPGPGQQADGEGQAQAGDMSRDHRRPAQPHIQPEVPHPQPLSHRAVLHIGRHAAELLPGYLPTAAAERTARKLNDTARELQEHCTSSILTFELRRMNGAAERNTARSRYTRHLALPVCRFSKSVSRL